MFVALTDVDNQHRLSMKHPDSHTQSTQHSDLEALVCEIAAREGVSLSTKHPRTFTSITTSTHRCPTSPSPSISSAPPASPAPFPLHITELSTEPNRPVVTNQSFPPHMDEDEDEVAALAQTTREQPSVYEASNSFQSRNQSVMSQSNVKNQKRQDTVVGQSEELPSLTHDLDKTDVTVQPDSAQSHYEESSNHISFVSGVGQKPNQAAGSGSTARPDHVSNVHVSLYPKATDHSSASAAKSAPPDAASGLPQQLFVTPRDPASAGSSLDEGVGSSSPPEWYHSREPERSDTFNTFQTVVAQRQATAAASTQSLIPRHTAGTATAETPGQHLKQGHERQQVICIPLLV